MLVYVSHTRVQVCGGQSWCASRYASMWMCCESAGVCYHMGVGAVLVVVHALITSERHILCVS